MKPWRAAETSATASGKSTRMASRSAIACSSTEPSARSCFSAAPVSSTAVFSVSVANCSRCDSCIASVCFSANSRNPRMRSSGSPPRGNPKPPSICVLSSLSLNLRADAEQPLRRLAERADRARVRRVPAVRGHRRLLRRRDPAAARVSLLPPGGRGAKPRHDDRPVPPGRRPARAHPRRRGAPDGLLRRSRPRPARPRPGEASHRADLTARRARQRRGRPRRRAVPGLVPEGAARGGLEHVRPARDRRARHHLEPPARGGLPRPRPDRRPGRRPVGPGGRGRGALAERPLVPSLDVVRELVGGGDPLRVLRQAELDEPGAELAQVSPARALLRELAHGRDRDRISHQHPVCDRPPARVERKPLPLLAAHVRAQVDAGALAGLRRDDGGELLTVGRVRPSGLARRGQLILERHRRNNSHVPLALTERNRAAQELFAPLGPTYDRYAWLLSFGQDPRWRSFLVSRIEAGPGDTVLDVATGTAAVAIDLTRRFGCRVVGVDQSAEMLASARDRVRAAGLEAAIELREARAEELPYADAAFDGLTVTYLLRYVHDPAATMRELARVVRPGGRIAMLDFFVPGSALARASWEGYVRIALPLLARAISPGWGGVGSFLGPSIRNFWARWPLERQLAAWSSAGIADVRARPLSLGGGIVLWGTRGD